MFRISDLGDYKIFAATEKAEEAARGMSGNACRLNNAFLAENHHKPRQTGRISGSFIYAHAPNYEGISTLKWDEAQWLSLFNEMKNAGLDTVVFQASIWNELGECYYKSSHFCNDYRQFKVIESMLPAAKKAGLRIYLGGYGSAVGWSSCLDRDTIKDEVYKQLACMKELLKYGVSFDGIYFAPETAVAAKDCKREKALNELYKRYFSELKNISEKHLILMSPATKYAEENADLIFDGWNTLLAGVPLDILGPQDSIGCSCTILAHQYAAWHLWKKIADSTGVRLWANIELFERCPHRLGECPFVAATPERITTQINNVTDFAEKIICWEYPYFAGRKETPGAALVRARIFQHHKIGS